MSPNFGSRFSRVFRSQSESADAAPKAIRAARLPKQSAGILAQVTLVVVAGVATGVSFQLIRLGVPSSVAAIVWFCAVWLALYPVVRLDQTAPHSTHWTRGAFVVLILEILWLLRLLLDNRQ